MQKCACRDRCEHLRGLHRPQHKSSPPVLCEPGARGGSHLGVVAADGATALGGAAGVALVGVREGEVLLLAVPRAHHVHHGAVPAKGACGVGGTPRCRNHCSPGQKQWLRRSSPHRAPSAGSQLPGAPRGALTCPSGWRGSAPRTSSAGGGRAPTRTAQPTPPPPWPAARPTPGEGEKKGQWGFGLLGAGRWGNPLLVFGEGDLNPSSCPQNLACMSVWKRAAGRGQIALGMSLSRAQERDFGRQGFRPSMKQHRMPQAHLTCCVLSLLLLQQHPGTSRLLPAPSRGCSHLPPGSAVPPQSPWGPAQEQHMAPPAPGGMETPEAHPPLQVWELSASQGTRKTLPGQC